MCLVKRLVLGAIIICIDVVVTSRSAADFGPCVMRILDTRSCSGPKQKNCTNITTTQDSQQKYLIQEINVLENIVPHVAKIQAFTSNSTQVINEIIRYQMDDPCRNIFLKHVFTELFNMTNKCIIKKNLYHVKIDIDRIGYDYYGGKFFYGNFTFKWMVATKKCNITCHKAFVSVEPK